MIEAKNDPASMSIVERVARAQWEQRRKKALEFMPDHPLEEWGDGSVPKSNGIMEEARAAIEAMRGYGKLASVAMHERANKAGWPAEYECTCFDDVINAALEEGT